jgi:uncharacterized membrane protein YgcG
MRAMRHPCSLVMLCAMALSGAAASAQDAPAAKPFKAEEIDQLVAPVALYPDSLLAQVLMASTYPLEVVEAARWAKANPKVTGEALESAMQKQTWDPSVKSLTAFPQVLTMMNEKLDWTQKLGDAFLAQQSDVMDAVQRLRARAKQEGNLESNEQQKVVVEEAPPAPAAAAASGGDQSQTTIIKVEPADPQVVYVPTYNPTVVYGAWPYPAYPPYYYYPPGYVAATSIVSFGVGMAVGAALWGDCNWGWGHGDVDVNVNNYNNFNRTNINNKKWEHNVDHRKGVQYRDKATQQRFGKGQAAGVDSREAFRGRAEAGRQEMARTGTSNIQRDLQKQQPGGLGEGGAGGAKRAGDHAPAARQNAGQGAGMEHRGGGEQRAGQGGAGSHSRGQDLANSRVAPKDPSAFRGMGNGDAARRDSVRGHDSRRSAQSLGGGGGGGGGGRRGGGGAGRGGGGGGRRR